MKVRSNDAEIFYEVLGDGPPLVLLHAFPTNHNLWRPVADQLASRYRMVLMDLRAHGESGVGDGPTAMDKHAVDVARVCDEAGVGQAVFAGVSIGGYVLFEFWRRFRQRVKALVLADTRAQADTEDGRAARLKSADEVEKNGPDAFLESMLTKLLGETTRTNRPDIVGHVKQMAAKMTVYGLAAVQRGMAARPDSVPTLSTINVPALLLFGAEDVLTPVADGELMRQHIPSSRLVTVPRAGHLSVFEQPEPVLELMRGFLGSQSR